jgi:hypothetical protein
MKRNDLILLNKPKILDKIKNFFNKIFIKKEITSKNEIVIEKENKVNKDCIGAIKRQNFEILELQKKYRKGEIKESQMTHEQKKALIDLYDSQIKNLKKSNELRKQKLLRYKKKLGQNNKNI